MLLDEAVECFLRQDYPNKELVILNDTPGAPVEFDHPQVRIINLDERIPSLSAKLVRLVEEADGDVLCRWDDDDLSLPWRLSFSMRRMGGNLEWRANNHWFDDVANVKETKLAGNSHVMAIWRREVLKQIGGYPHRGSGVEDKQFNAALIAAGFPTVGDHLDPRDIFYVYRWATGSHHLSGHKTDSDWRDVFNENYERIGEAPIPPGPIVLRPRWREDYLARYRLAADRLLALQSPHTEGKS